MPSARLGGVFELPVRPPLPHLLPPVRFDHVNDVANLHGAI